MLSQCGRIHNGGLPIRCRDRFDLFTSADHPPQIPQLPSETPPPPSESLRQMLARRNISRGSSQWLAQATSSQRRGVAAVTNPFHYTVGEAAGIKVASRDDGGPTTNLAIVVRGGSRYESAPGVAHGLEKFAFKVCSECR